MAKEINIEAAKKHLWMRGSMLMDLAQNDAYIQFLIQGENLTPLEQALCDEVRSLRNRSKRTLLERKQHLLNGQ